MLIAGPYSAERIPPFPASLTMHVNDVIIDSIDRAAEKAPADMENTTIKNGEPIFYFEKTDDDKQKKSDENNSMSVEKDDDVTDDVMEKEGEDEEKEEEEEEKEIRVVPRDVLTKLMEPFIYCVAYVQDKSLYKEVSKKIFKQLSYDNEWPHIMRDTEAIRKEIMAFSSKAEAELMATEEDNDDKKKEEEEKEEEEEEKEEEEEGKEEEEENKVVVKRRKPKVTKQFYPSRLMAVAMIMHEAKKTGGVDPGLADVPTVNELVAELRERYSQDRKPRPRTKTLKKGKRRSAHRKKNLDRKRKKYYNSINK